MATVGNIFLRLHSKRDLQQNLFKGMVDGVRAL